MNGQPRRAETMPVGSRERWTDESLGKEAVAGEQGQGDWNGWMDAIDEGELEPPRQNGLMMHSNHSLPSLRHSPPKQAHPPLPTVDDLHLDRLRLADESFTPPPRQGGPAAPPPSSQGLPSNPAIGRAKTSIGGSQHIPGHLRKDSANSTRSKSSQQGGPSWAGDRPDSVGSVQQMGEADGNGGIEGSDDGGHRGYPQQQQQGHYPQMVNFGPGPGGYGHSDASLGGGQWNGYPSDHQGQGQQQYLPQQQPGLTPGGYGQPPQMMPQGYFGATQLTGQYYGQAPGQMAGYSGQYGPTPGYDPYAQHNLGRTASMASSVPSNGSFGSLGRTGTSLSATVGGPPKKRPQADSAHRPMISKASIDEYRNRIKNDPDPETHFNYAKFLVEAAKRLASGGAAGDDKAIKKYRDALLGESLKLIKRLATQGVGLGKPAYADAQFFLANCLGNGSLGLQVDHEKAYNLYVQASKQNHPAATYRTAVCNELGAGTRKDANRAILFYRKASALGDTAGMYKLGMILLNGLLGQQRNPKEALLWLKRAAQQADEDNPHALHELALLYENPPSAGPTGPGAQPGQGGYLVAYDEAYARELFTQAAQLGYAPAQNKLGSCYEYGALTCPIDPRRSIAWYTRAAERGDAESELALSGWYLTGSEGVLKQSDSEAYLWARRAANKGLPKAEYAVGYYSEVGIGVKADLEEAKRWYMRAASNKNKRAMQRLTELKKLGAQKPGKKAARPTREQAAGECVVS